MEKSLGLQLPERVFDKQTGTILRLVFLGTRAEEPVLNEATRRFAVHPNLLHGRIEYIDDRPIGILIVSLEWQKHQVRNAIEYFQQNVAHLEVIRSVHS